MLQSGIRARGLEIRGCGLNKFHTFIFRPSKVRNNFFLEKMNAEGVLKFIIR